MRTRSADDSSAVSLFPFLAVLVCTMGSLIVLLVVMARQARRRAARTPQVAGISAADQEAEAARVETAIGRFGESGARVGEQLTESRRVLSHLEDHIRRLRDQMRRLERGAAQLAESGQSDVEQRRRDKAEVARFKSLIADAKKQLNAARREARRRSYAIVPYQGENGTGRRPIYIECRADTVVLQPEGIVLKARDFAEPLGPGNPLAAALRAAREYYTDRQTPTGGGTDTYPLLLLRPDGIAAYYKVREAIASWDAEFGYELIEADWSLELPPPDPQLAYRESRAVETARARRASLAIAAPSRYGGKGGWRVRAAPHRGGFQTVGPGGARAADGRFGHGSFAGRRAGDRQQTGDRPPGDGQQTGDRPADGRQRTDDRYAGSRQTGGRQQTGKSPDGEFGERAAAFSGPPGSVTAPGGSSAGGSSGGGSSGARAAGGTFGTGLASSGSLATKRGANWALPNAGRGAVPISRPVRVVLRHDRVAVLPDRTPGADIPQENTAIPFSDRTADAVDQFVSTLWDHIGTWGIAGHGMYWRPVLHLHIAPDAEQRAVQFRELLKGSGLEFEERGAIVR